jgi:predicted dehydrogenase
MEKKTIERRAFLKQASTAAAIGLAFRSTRVLGANDRVRLGIIGPGARGQELMREFLNVANIEFVAAADVYTRRQGEVGQIAPGIKTVADHRRLLDMKNLDAVIVASPLHCHSRHFLDTLAAGKDLYCEKTMTWSIAEAEACLEAARKSNRVVGIGLQHQSSGNLKDNGSRMDWWVRSLTSNRG